MSVMISVFDFFTRNTLSSPRSDSRHHHSCAGNEARYTKPHHSRAPSPSHSSPRSSAPTTAPASPAMAQALRIQMPALDPVIRSSTPAGSPPSRPNSPHSGYRPSSRSERLLRDTLRKADERQSREPSLPRRTSSGRSRTNHRERSVEEDPQELDEAAWLSNGPRTAQILHRQSISITPSRCPSPLQTEDMAPFSSSPVAPPLSRTQTAPSPTHRRGSYSLSAVPIPRSMTPGVVSPTPSSSLQHNGSHGQHEAFLRSRLENVLSRVSSAPQFESPDFRGKPFLQATRTYSGNDLVGHARSQSLVYPNTGQSDWPWTGSPDSSEPAGPLTPPPTPPSNTSPLSPATPPSPFNARAANQICRQMPAYVSFQDVEGLGEPPNLEDEQRGAEDKGSDDKKWWNWPWTGRARAQSR